MRKLLVLEGPHAGKSITLGGTVFTNGSADYSHLSAENFEKFSAYMAQFYQAKAVIGDDPAPVPVPEDEGGESNDGSPTGEVPGELPTGGGPGADADAPAGEVGSGNDDAGPEPVAPAASGPNDQPRPSGHGAGNKHSRRV